MIGLVRSGFTRVGLGFKFLTNYQLCMLQYVHTIRYVGIVVFASIIERRYSMGKYIIYEYFEL